METMIEYHLDTATSVLTLRPESALQKNDFVTVAQALDPQLEQHGDLAGLIIDAPHFPGWSSFGALVNHLRFIRDHHRHVKKIAMVTDSPLGDVAEHITAHFIAAEVKHFPAGEAEQARGWILAGS